MKETGTHRLESRQRKEEVGDVRRREEMTLLHARDTATAEGTAAAGPSEPAPEGRTDILSRVQLKKCR